MPHGPPTPAANAATAASGTPGAAPVAAAAAPPHLGWLMPEASGGGAEGTDAEEAGGRSDAGHAAVPRQLALFESSPHVFQPPQAFHKRCCSNTVPGTQCTQKRGACIGSAGLQPMPILFSSISRMIVNVYRSPLM